jgi:outer membrane protein assembly factor BamB
METGLLKSWPAGGPEMIWSYEGLGAGFSSAAIDKGTIFITGEIDKVETLFSFDLDGNLLWKTSYGPIWKGSYSSARTTPTVDGSYIYVKSGMGNLVCFDRTNGDIRWSKQTIELFDAEFHRWGIAESPLIVDDLLISTPGGKKASMVAFDKISGDLVWRTEELSEQASYCSPILIERGGKKIIATLLAYSFVGVNAENGDVLWRDDLGRYNDDPKDINPVSPFYKDGYIFTTSGYDDGSVMYELSEDGTSVKAKWTEKTLDVHHGGFVVLDGYIYGSNWLNNSRGNWVCLDWSTGRTMYEEKWITKGSIIAADGMLYCYDERKGNMALVKATPEKFDFISSFEVPLGSGQHWSHPAISDGRLYIRHGEALMVYNIKK